MTQGIRAAAFILLAAFIAAPAFAQDDTAGVYKSKCAMCHGADGTAATPMGKKLEMLSFRAPAVAKLSDQQLFDITQNGKGKMPAYKGKLTEDQIKSQVKYIRSLK